MASQGGGEGRCTGMLEGVIPHSGPLRGKGRELYRKVRGGNTSLMASQGGGEGVVQEG